MYSLHTNRLVHLLTKRLTTFLCLFVIGLSFPACSKQCGSLADARIKYHDACVAVTFREHVEISGNRVVNRNTLDYGTGTDQFGESVDLIGDQLRKLEPNKLYNLRGDFVEVDSETRFKVFEVVDLTLLNQNLTLFIVIVFVGFGLYRWAFVISTRKVMGKPDKGK
jgi:hypothetical protein